MANTWNQGAIDAGGGDYFGCSIGEIVVLQIAGMFEFVDKTFDESKGPQSMCEIPAHNLGDPTEDGTPRTFSTGRRRSQPLLALCAELDGKGLDPRTRAIRVEVNGRPHPTKAGQTIGDMVATDLGPATEHGGVSLYAAAAVAADPATACMDAMGKAADLDALKAAFGPGYKAADATVRHVLKAAYDERKAAFEDSADVPF